MRSPLPRVSRRGKVTFAVVGVCPGRVDLRRPARRPLDRLAVVRRGRLHERLRRAAADPRSGCSCCSGSGSAPSSAATSTWPSGCGRCCGPTRRSSTRWSATGCSSRPASACGSRSSARVDRPLRRALRRRGTGSSGCCSRNGGDFGIKDPQFNTDVGFYVFDFPFWRYLLDVGFTADRAGDPRLARHALPLRRGAAAGRRRPDEHRGAGPPDRAGGVLRAAQGGRVLPGQAGAAARATTPAPTCGAPATPTSTRCCRPRRS